MSAFFMGFLDKSKGISLATISVFSIMLWFLNQTGMWVLNSAGNNFSSANLHIFASAWYQFKSLRLEIYQLPDTSPATVFVAPLSKTAAFQNSMTSVFRCSG